MDVQILITKLERLESQNAGLFREFQKVHKERAEAVEELKKTNQKLFWWMKLCSVLSALFLGAALTAAYIAYSHSG
jgi:hypothetical protein